MSAVPVDKNASRETINLFGNLENLAQEKLMYGQHHCYLLGDHVDGSGDTSDCQYVTGSHPAVAGFDFVRDTAWAPDDSSKPFYVQCVALYNRGGIPTFSWHQTNPGGGGAYDLEKDPVPEILDNGSRINQRFKDDLREIAGFFNSLKVDGVNIPVIYRPYHENSGSWFWWGADFCTPDEYRQLWQLTYHFLTDICDVHNLLWAYSPSKPDSVGNYNDRYPGDDYVDILGFDWYGRAGEDEAWPENVRNTARIVCELAEEKGKVAAYTEAGERKGFRNTDLSNWFSLMWLDNFKNDPIAKKLSYVLTWNSPAWSCFQTGTNAHCYDDFMKFYRDEFTVFEEDLPSMYDTPK